MNIADNDIMSFVLKRSCYKEKNCLKRNIKPIRDFSISFFKIQIDFTTQFSHSSSIFILRSVKIIKIHFYIQI